MNDLHKRLTKENHWYAAWHKVPYVSLLHFVIFAGVGSLLALHVQGAVLAQNVVHSQSDASATVGVGKAEGNDFGPWFTISKWDNCSHLMQQGRVFEIQNSEGQSMLSECTPQVPKGPFDWHSGPARFRLVKEPKPIHDEPLPLPRNN